MSLKIALVAGEASGDQLGASLIQAIRQRHPNTEFAGVAGPAMQAAGCHAWHDSEELAVMGLFEVVRHLPRLLRLRRVLARRIAGFEPDVFVGIDAPDFNLGLEIKLKRHGIKTVHYVSPTVWAWRQGRVKKIAQAVIRLLALFPFEPAFYSQHGVDAQYIGHPMADEIPLLNEQAPARSALQLPPDGTVVALLPGSRSAEISRLAPLMLATASRLSNNNSDLRFVAALANARGRQLFEACLAGFPDLSVQVFEGQARQAITASDLTLVASGTATLETLLINRPMVVCYRVAAASFWLGRVFRLIKTEFIALPNILAGKQLVPEFLQAKANVDTLTTAVQELLNNDQARATLTLEFEAIHRQLTRDASQQAARAILELAG